LRSNAIKVRREPPAADLAAVRDVLYGANAPQVRVSPLLWIAPMTLVALGLIPGLMLGWIALCVAEISTNHPDIAKRRGCRGGACRAK
jgi:hypothetical protein